MEYECSQRVSLSLSQSFSRSIRAPGSHWCGAEYLLLAAADRIKRLEVIASKRANGDVVGGERELDGVRAQRVNIV